MRVNHIFLLATSLTSALVTANPDEGNTVYATVATTAHHSHNLLQPTEIPIPTLKNTHHSHHPPGPTKDDHPIRCCAVYSYYAHQCIEATANKAEGFFCTGEATSDIDAPPPAWLSPPIEGDCAIWRILPERGRGCLVKSEGFPGRYVNASSGEEVGSGEKLRCLGPGKCGGGNGFSG